MNVSPSVRSQCCMSNVQFPMHLTVVRTLAPAQALQLGLATGCLLDVTVADFTVQAVVAWRLDRECPGDRLVAEEDSAALRTPEAREILESVAGAARSTGA